MKTVPVDISIKSW